LVGVLCLTSMTRHASDATDQIYRMVLTFAFNTPSIAQVEPDRPYSTVGPWKVSTTRWGVGCVAQFEYQSANFVSIGGETPQKMVLVIEVNRKLFGVNLDDEGEVESFVELVIGQSRWDKLSPYGYRGTAGVVAAVDSGILKSLSSEPSLKLTERGSVKVVAPLHKTKEAVAKLFECFKRTR
jgi:hypothetical protein